MKIGLDVGSTTLKCVVLDDENCIIYSKYVRHFSQIAEKASEMLLDIADAFPDSPQMPICISGSAGMGLAGQLGIPFTQEVYATMTAVKFFAPDTDAVIELGGEDAKILFMGNSQEVRMNGSCAGGTGAFIDQMSTLLGLTPDEMDFLAEKCETKHTIASRCGVFAKSDLQSLLNWGAKKEDISASIFFAVVNQTVAGLAQGRKIEGNVLYLGGPLTYMGSLRAAFDEVLGLEGWCPENSLYFVAFGAAMTPGLACIDIREAAEKIADFASLSGFKHCAPLFADEQEFDKFKKRHSKSRVLTNARPTESGRIWVGIDAGSTTVKAVAVNEDGNIVFSRYTPNSGNPVPIVKGFLTELYAELPEAIIAGCATTGYGEEIIKNAFRLNCGVVETIAHFMAARAFDPDVDFILDIGGQDIKCFKIQNGAIDNIFLNEACSSGCGSFLQSFAGALGYTAQEFASLGLFAPTPVDLGSRCTVFMNSSVKQAQKDGADLTCISAGLSISVVKNALYKVIRIARPEELGRHIVVQGGTFMSDAVLRSFEQETGRDVIRPTIAGLMGAFGAALYAKEQNLQKSNILSTDELRDFKHEVRTTYCGGCTNNCLLTINTFNGGRRFIAGNRCEKPVSGKKGSSSLDIYAYKRSLLAKYAPIPGVRGKLGIPMGLGSFELLPFWHAFFTCLGFEVVSSPESNRDTYFKGQHTIPSDTVCYPAKLMHGHIEALLDMGVDAIFYPCLTYNINEGKSDNFYNCPVVAYYPEVINANVREMRGTKFIYDYIGIHRERDFPKKMHKILAKYFPGIPLRDIKNATKVAFSEYSDHMGRIRAEGLRVVAKATAAGIPIIILAGRPYHIDPEINHGIPELINELGAAVISEDSISDQVEKFPTNVLNQWTYHARMYAAAKYITESENPNLNLVQLVSFGCGVDAVTSDEVRSILEEGDRIYTQIKIDEITNLGAVKIRIRSLFAAIEQKKGSGSSAKKDKGVA